MTTNEIQLLQEILTQRIEKALSSLDVTRWNEVAERVEILSQTLQPDQTKLIQDFLERQLEKEAEISRRLYLYGVLDGIRLQDGLRWIQETPQSVEMLLSRLEKRKEEAI